MELGPRRHRTHGDGSARHAAFVEMRVMSWQPLGTAKGGPLCWTLGSLTTTLPALCPGLQSVSYYPGTTDAMPIGHETY